MKTDSVEESRKTFHHDEDTDGQETEEEPEDEDAHGAAPAAHFETDGQ